MQRFRVGGLIEDEAGARDGEKARPRCGVTLRRKGKRPAGVAAEAHEKGHAEANHIGGKRLQVEEFHDKRHHREMGEGGCGANRNEDRDLSHFTGSPASSGRRASVTKGVAS